MCATLQTDLAAGTEGREQGASGGYCLRIDQLIHGRFNQGADIIVDARITDLDSKTPIRTAPDQVFAAHERKKKAKYLASCMEQRRHFTPLVVSTDEMIGW